MRSSSSSFAPLSHLIGVRKYTLSYTSPLTSSPAPAMYRHLFSFKFSPLSHPLAPCRYPLTSHLYRSVEIHHKVKFQLKCYGVCACSREAVWNSGFLKLNGTRGLWIHFGVKCAASSTIGQVIIYRTRATMAHCVEHITYCSSGFIYNIFN